jgi:hypothetical protein
MTTTTAQGTETQNAFSTITQHIQHLTTLCSNRTESPSVVVVNTDMDKLLKEENARMKVQLAKQDFRIQILLRTLAERDASLAN